MSVLDIDFGVPVGPNANSGDTVFDAFLKVESSVNAVYTAYGDGSGGLLPFPIGLFPTGVTPGAYVTPTVTINQYGQIVTAVGQGAVAPAQVYAGPGAGPADLPGFRSLISTDIPLFNAGAIGAINESLYERAKQTPQVVDFGLTAKNVPSLRLMYGPVDRASISTLGFLTDGDQGDADYYWDAGSSAVDDGGTVINPTGNVGNGRWLLMLRNGSVSVKAFGARGDDATDDSSAFQRAANWMYANGGEIFMPAGTYDLRQTTTYIATDHHWGPCWRGVGDATILRYHFTGGSLFKVRNTIPFRYTQGGWFRSFKVTTLASYGYAFWSQQAVLDLSNMFRLDIRNVTMNNVKGHGIWTPLQYVSVNNPGSGANDLPNDKPWVYIDRSVPAGRIAQLYARVSAGAAPGGVITGFKILRPGSGYVAGAAVHVTGSGTLFAGTVILDLTSTGDTHTSTTVDNIVSTAGVVVGMQVSGTNIVAGTMVSAVTSTTVTLTIAASGSTVGGALTFNWLGGGIAGVNITNGGSGYNELTDHLSDQSSDAFTCSDWTIQQNDFQFLDGCSVVMPHFSDAYMYISGNNSIFTGMGFVLFGGNGCVIENNSFGVSGLTPTAGFYPGIALMRIVATCQNVRIAHNEMDTNCYAQVLIDGANCIRVTNNRFNSWVTALNSANPFWTGQTTWTQQVPQMQVAEEIGLPSGETNTDIIIENNAHRAQPTNSTIPFAAVACMTGNAVLTLAAAGSQGNFILGCRVKLLNGSTPVTFSGGTLSETTILSFNSATITLNATPDSTVASASLLAVINDEFTTWISLGRNANSVRTNIIDPNQAQNSAIFTKVANYRSNLGPTGAFRYIDGTQQQLGNPGLGGTSVRISAATVVTIPIAPTPVVIPWVTLNGPANINSDPDNRMEATNTGRYFCINSGVYEATGQLAINTATAGDVFVIQCCVDNDAMDVAGVLTQTTTVIQERYFYATGAAIEIVPFSFSVLATANRTYIAPSVVPPTTIGSAALATADAGLIWWDPTTKISQLWSGTVWAAAAKGHVNVTTTSGVTTVTASPIGFAVGAMVQILNAGVPINFGTAVPPITQTTIASINAAAGTMVLTLAPQATLAPGVLTLMTQFQPKTAIKLRVLSTNRGSSIALNTSASTLNWCAFKQMA